MLTTDDEKCSNVEDVAYAGDLIEELIISEEEIRNHLFNVEIKTSPGPDGLSNKLL